MPKRFTWLSKKGISRPLYIAVACNACKTALAVAIFFLWIPSALLFANNVTVANVEQTDQDSSADTVKIEFDLYWNNAWKDTINHDAVWVFAKYCTANCSTNGTWAHATLGTEGTNPTGFSDGTKNSGAFNSLEIVVPPFRKGAFFQPSAAGSGTVDFLNAQIVWDYGHDGVSDANATGANTRIKVFAIEMVYIPEGSFYIGDGNNGGLGEFEWEASQEGPISSTGPVDFDPNVGGQSSFYYNTDLGFGGAGGNDDATAAPFAVGESYPKGFQPFYLMKYELSQGQYRDFLNTLTQAQQASRVTSDITNENDANTYVMIAEGQATPVTRQTIKAGANPANGDPYTFTCDLDDDNVGDESVDGEWIAMNYISWMDLCAYADWAALRPYSELEFEKSCRGPITSLVNERAWGNTSVTQAQGAISNSGQTSEVAANTGNNLCNYNGGGTDTNAPLRSGFAATSSTTTRIAAGASYYGVLDLSGNLWERTVTVGNNTGRSFSGTHGDGVLNSSGNADNPDWPGISSGAVTGATGSGFRGGSWTDTDTNYLEVSNRQVAGTTDTTRRTDSGARLARSEE